MAERAAQAHLGEIERHVGELVGDAAIAADGARLEHAAERDRDSAEECDDPP